MKLNLFARIILSPLALLYGFIISIRNGLFEAKLLKASRFNLPVLGVGNLSMGGAGKTPHVEYLVNLLKDYVNIGVISRGYKRKTKGLRAVTKKSTVREVGDEPLMYYLRFTQEISVFVAENRNLAIPQILHKNRHIDCFILDDAFQHRAVEAGLNILLTPFQHPYTRDYLLPMGRLRERRSEAERANIIIVSKCPPNLSNHEKRLMQDELKIQDHQILVFSQYLYGLPYNIFDTNQKRQILENTHIFLLSAIANTDYLLEYLVSKSENIHLFEYEDHHYFTIIELENLIKTYKIHEEGDKIILTTEKDAIRLFEHRSFLISHSIRIFVIPIKVQFFPNDQVIFESAVKKFMREFKI